MDSRFQELDSGFQVVDSGFHAVDSGFQGLDSGLQELDFGFAERRQRAVRPFTRFVDYGLMFDSRRSFSLEYDLIRSPY